MSGPFPYSSPSYSTTPSASSLWKRRKWSHFLSANWARLSAYPATAAAPSCTYSAGLFLSFPRLLRGLHCHWYVCPGPFVDSGVAGVNVDCTVETMYCSSVAGDNTCSLRRRTRCDDPSRSPTDASRYAMPPTFAVSQLPTVLFASTAPGMSPVKGDVRTC